VSASRASLLAGSVTVAAIVLIVLAATAVDRAGRQWLLVAGYAVSLLGAVLGVVFWLTGNLHSWLTLYLSGAVLLLGVSVMDPLVYAYTTELYPTRMRSWGTMSSSAWRAVAAVVAPILIGQILQSGLGVGVVFVLFGGVLVVGLVVQSIWGIETKQAQLERLSR
jgi:putative MFS transporter